MAGQSNGRSDSYGFGGIFEKLYEHRVGRIFHNCYFSIIVLYRESCFQDDKNKKLKENSQSAVLSDSQEGDDNGEEKRTEIVEHETSKDKNSQEKRNGCR